MTQTIVLLHYFSGSSESWRYVARCLPADRKVVTLDLPGFGQSPMIANPSIRGYSTWVWQQLKHLGIERFVLIGHSMGGKIAMDMAAMQSSQPGDSQRHSGLQRLGLIAPSPATCEPMPESKKDELESTHPSAAAAENMVDDSAISRLSMDRRDLAVQTNLQSHRQAWRWWLREGMEHSIAKEASQIDVPVSVLASDDDPVIPMANLERDVIGIIPDSRLTRVRDVGHLMPLEDERLVADWIANL
ncbi:Dihydrolipoyllysine-residue acetyltransferase component of acetoin cleaving system [Rubripirellula obstinata]|uniref:Dihydrolipoyllysine-residue acetyltransferase component of acetoin cleaving system n=1 Tax=Rubripirellula obstinata TaxID=406547 RepID=A0A5B1CPH1_9BACT|nr:alpha/beta hydrolase [Rubripirellula obstinata]KAA1261184.1 Dihydrolipoyllysine-residue acetyltransferase component of acetoin cleaving system [Rubripirellula obstinata]